MSSTRELITLQIGHYANFVGTHMWNIQSSCYSTADASGKISATKEIDFDVTFREGRTLTNQVTYTPRTVIFDLKGSLNTLKQDGTLYDVKVSNQVETKWPEAQVALHNFSGAERNDFLLAMDEEEHQSSQNIVVNHGRKDKDTTDTERQEAKARPSSERINLDSVVRVWSDFLKPHLHPKTISLITAEHYSNYGFFNLHSMGCEAYKSQRSDVEDRLHFFSEECDNLQGFQLLVDCHDAFGGFAASLFEDYLQEEFGNKSCFIVNTLPSSLKADHHKSLISFANIFLSYNIFNTSTSAILPLSTENSLLYNPSKSCSINFPFVKYNPSLPYHTSAILASAFDNLTLPYRMIGSGTDLNYLISSLTGEERQVLGAQMSFPFACNEDSSLFEILNPDSLPKMSSCAAPLPEFTSLTPCLTSAGSVAAQCASFSGLDEEQLFGHQKDAAKFRYSSSTDLIQDYLLQSFNTRMNAINLFKTPGRVTDPYPHLFSAKLNPFGVPSSRKRSKPELSQSTKIIEALPVATLLQNNSGVGDHLKEIKVELDKIGPSKVYQYFGSAIEGDDFIEKKEKFSSLLEKYERTVPDMI